MFKHEEAVGIGALVMDSEAEDGHGDFGPIALLLPVSTLLSIQNEDATFGNALLTAVNVALQAMSYLGQQPSIPHPIVKLFP